jgi:CRISPR-associated protein Cmr1
MVDAMNEKKELTVTLETVTPLFLGGADPRGAPELRVPSFRGVLRYWLRAALGGVMGDHNREAIQKTEAAVFGSTDYSSPISFRLILEKQPNRSQEPILPHKPDKGKRCAFDPGQDFDLKIWANRSLDATIWQVACAALRLSLTFGGVGLRSRRGYGTLKPIRSSDHSLLSLFPKTLQDWKTHAVQSAENAIDAAGRLAQFRNVPVKGQCPEGLTAFPCASRAGLIQICDLKAANAIDAVRQFMTLAQGDRAFGGINPRQASPLWVRPILTEKGYGLLFMVLTSRLTTGTDYSRLQGFLNQHFSGMSLTAKGWNG